MSQIPVRTCSRYVVSPITGALEPLKSRTLSQSVTAALKAANSTRALFR